MALKPDMVIKPALKPDQLVALDDVRIRFAAVWLIGSGIIFLLLVLQSLLNTYGDLTTEAWGWLLPTLMPSLGLMVTVLTYTALDPNMTGSMVRRSFVPIALWLSVVYLLTVLLTILVQPFATKTAADAIGLMKMSNLWLGPFQSLVASSLGVLFASKQKGEGTPQG
ncbi:MAG TPA: hypothetical protein VGG85_09205 [Terracidiphilus sp.]|jgi:hypothetical protein